MSLRDTNAFKGDIGALQVTRWLVEAGCAVNFLANSDVGFDLHVQLPQDYTNARAAIEGRANSTWQLSPYSALVQAKGGLQAESGIRLPVSKWQFYLRSATPVYLAGSRDGERVWVAPIHTVVNETELGVRDESASHQVRPAKTNHLDREMFVTDALARALLGALPAKWARDWQSSARNTSDLALLVDRLALYQSVAGDSKFQYSAKSWQDARADLLLKVPERLRSRVRDTEISRISDLIDQTDSGQVDPEVVLDAGIVRQLPSGLTLGDIVAAVADGVRL